MRNSHKRLIVSFFLLVSYTLVSGCPNQINNQEVKIDLGDKLNEVLDKTESSKKVRSVTIFPDKVSLNIGESKKLTATIKYTDDTTDTNVIWDNPVTTSLSVSPDGTLLGLRSGQVTLTATSAKDAEKRATVVVTINSVKVTGPSPTANANGPLSAPKDVTPGKAGYALQLNGIDSFVSIPSTDLLNPVSNLTMESWVNIKKFSESSEGAFFPVILKGTQNVRYGFIVNSNNTVDVRLDNKKYLIQDKAYSLNTWYHLAITWDGTNINLYRNGILSGSVESSTELLTVSESSPIYLGADLSSREKFAGGQLDNVRIWNYQLTQEEIRANMHLNLKGDNIGLAGYWKFDEGSGSLAADASASKSKGNLVNRSSWVVSGAPILADE